MPRLSTFILASVILTLAVALPITWIGTLVYFSNETDIFSAFFLSLGEVWIFYIAFLAGALPTQLF